MDLIVITLPMDCFLVFTHVSLCTCIGFSIFTYSFLSSLLQQIMELSIEGIYLYLKYVLDDLLLKIYSKLFQLQLFVDMYKTRGNEAPSDLSTTTGYNVCVCKREHIQPCIKVQA